MELETVRNATTRELDWDNALVLNAGSFCTLNNTSITQLLVDINGDKHSVNAGEKFEVSWTVPSDGRLSLIRQSNSDAHLLATQGVPKKLTKQEAYTGLMVWSPVYISTVEVEYYLKAQDETLKATLVSPKVTNLGVDFSGTTSHITCTTTSCQLLDDVTVGRECVKGDKVSLNCVVPLNAEPPSTSYNALLFVPYKEG